MSGRRTNKGTEEEGYCPTHWLSSLWNAMYPFHYLGKKAFETVLSSQGQKGWKRPLVRKGRSLWITGYSCPSPGKLALPLPVNQSVTSSPSTLVQPTIYVLRTKDSGAWRSWLSGHVCTGYLGPYQPCTCHPDLWPPLPSLPLSCLTLNLCLSAPTPTLASPVLFQENGSPINPAYTLIDSLIFNPLLH